MPRFYSLRVNDIRRETTDCVSVALSIPEQNRDEFNFVQGQYLTMKAVINGEEVRRSYSICSSPTEGELRVAIKEVFSGQFSTYANKKLKIGDHLDVMPPMGKFHTKLDPEKQRHYVSFAAGSGITPIMSILKSVLETEPKSTFTLFYGNRATDSIIFLEQLEALKNIYLDRLSLHHILSREHPGSELFYGRIDQDKCRAFSRHLLDVEEIDEFFLCGPAPMIEDVSEVLRELGVDPKKIHFELFSSEGSTVGRRDISKGPKIESMISIKLDGITHHFPLSSDGDTILDAALKGGLDLPYACKGGVCCTCRAKLLEGSAEMEVNYALEPEELEAGYILTCQSHPTSNKLVVDFDN
ncbi:MAG: phenylacetic acid degradation protein [Saprospiraceae bacterium]|nr:MAG: phenylacetic acid degradation protein [Saprospiraceae bacterium]